MKKNGKIKVTVQQQPRGYQFIGTGHNTSDYAIIIQTLEKITADSKYIKEMDTKLVPYEIPEVYSLEREIKDIAKRKTTMDVLRQNICITVNDAMKSDFIKVGREINGAVHRARGTYAGRA